MKFHESLKVWQTISCVEIIKKMYKVRQWECITISVLNIYNKVHHVAQCTKNAYCQVLQIRYVNSTRSSNTNVDSWKYTFWLEILKIKFTASIRQKQVLSNGSCTNNYANFSETLNNFFQNFKDLNNYMRIIKI